MSPSVVFFFKMILAILRPLHFLIHVCIGLSISSKNTPGIPIQIVFHLSIGLRSVAVSSMLSLPDGLPLI